MKTNRWHPHFSRRLAQLQFTKNPLPWAACFLLASHLCTFGQETREGPAVPPAASETTNSNEGKTPELDEILRQIEVPAFHVQEVEISAVISLAQRYLGELTERKLPTFVVRLAPEILNKKISIHADAINAIGLLKEIAAAAGVELHTEDNVIAFSPSIRAVAQAGSVAEAKP
jgi:hypothetical protein